jgi:hypothetical protein
MRRFLAAAALVAAIATPAFAQQAQGTIEASLDIQGTALNGGWPSPWSKRFERDTKIDISVFVYNFTQADVTLDFPDPSDVVDLWIADARGYYVGWIPVAGKAQVTLPPGNGETYAAVWDQTDWWGRTLPTGIYTIEATVNTTSPFDSKRTYVELGDVPTSARNFTSWMSYSHRIVRPGAKLAGLLRVYNLTGRAQALRYAQGPFLPYKLSMTLRDAAGREVLAWTAPVPKIFTGPANDYIEAWGRLDYGPAVLRTVDPQTGAPLPAGRYTLVMTNTGDPKLPERRVTIDIAGAPVSTKWVIGTATDVPVHANGIATSPVITRVPPYTECVVLYEGTYWDRVQVEDMTGGTLRLVEGWIRKTNLTTTP